MKNVRGISPSVSILYHSLIRFARRAFKSCSCPRLLIREATEFDPVNLGSNVDYLAAGDEAAIDLGGIVESAGFA